MINLCSKLHVEFVDYFVHRIPENLTSKLNVEGIMSTKRNPRLMLSVLEPRALVHHRLNLTLSNQ
jgi:hypothetical protein